MARVNVTTDEGEVVEILTTDGWDLTKAARAREFLRDVLEATQRAERMEKSDV